MQNNQVIFSYQELQHQKKKKCNYLTTISFFLFAFLLLFDQHSILMSKQNLLAKTESKLLVDQAMFLINGQPIKGNNQQQSIDYGRVDKNLVTLDLKFDTLNQYLNNTSVVLNQHATCLNSISLSVQTELQLKCNEKDIVDGLVRASNCMDLSNEELSKIVAPLLPALRQENAGIPLEDSFNKLANKGVIHAKTFGLLFSKNKELEKKLLMLENKITELDKNKADKDKTKHKIKKVRSVLNDRISDIHKELAQKIETSEKKLISEIKTFEKMVADVEQSTLWKIDDCKKLLETRVNTQYVTDAINALYEQISKEVTRINGTNIDALNKVEENLMLKIKKKSKKIKNKVKEVIQTTSEIKVSVNNKLELLKFDEFKRIFSDKIEEISNKIRDVSRKFDPTLPLIVDVEKLFKLIKELESKFSTLDSKILPLQSLIDEIKNKPQETTIVINEETKVPQKVVEIPVNNEKLNELDILIHRTREDVLSYGNLINALTIEVAKKVDLNEFTIQVNKKLDKDEMLKLVERVTMDNERAEKIQYDVLNLSKKLENLNDHFEKRLLRLKKDFDLNSIQKLIKCKADEDEVKREFGSMDERFNTVNNSLNSFKKDLDSLLFNFKRIASNLSALSSESGTLASTKGTLCLSCGRGEAHFVPPSTMIKGSDGKLYYGDPTKSHANFDLGSDVFTRVEAVKEHESHLHNHLSQSMKLTELNKTAPYKPRPSSGNRIIKGVSKREVTEEKIKDATTRDFGALPGDAQPSTKSKTLLRPMSASIKK